MLTTWLLLVCAATMADAGIATTVQTVGFAPGIHAVPVSVVVQALVHSVAASLRRNAAYAVLLQKTRGTHSPPWQLGVFHSDNAPDTAYPTEIPAGWAEGGDTLRLVVVSAGGRTPLYYTGELVLSRPSGSDSGGNSGAPWLLSAEEDLPPTDDTGMALAILATPAAAEHDEYEDEHVQRKMALDDREPIETREPSVVSVGGWARPHVTAQGAASAAPSALGVLPLTARKPRLAPRSAAA